MTADQQSRAEIARLEAALRAIEDMVSDAGRARTIPEARLHIEMIALTVGRALEGAAS